MLTQVGHKVGEATGLTWITGTHRLHGSIQGRVGGIGEVKLVVPEGEQAFTGVAGDGQTQGMGIFEQRIALIAWKLAKVGELMNIGAMDGQGRPGFTQYRQGRRIAPIGNHGQTFEQSGRSLGNGQHKPAASGNRQRSRLQTERKDDRRRLHRCAYPNSIGGAMVIGL
jgi:hypothetical protein